MKRILRFAALALALATALSLASCKKKKEQKPAEKPVETGTISFADVYGLPSTEKIMGEKGEYPVKNDAGLTFDAVKNEYESAQLLITAAADTESFSLAAADLKNGETVFSKENITVYAEKFITYSGATSGTGSVGEAADALLPIEVAVEYGETSIEKDKNGGIWVTVYVPKDTAPGEYTGEFTLSMRKKGAKEDETMAVPVTLRVRDYTLSDHRTAKTIFTWRYFRVSPAELDGSVDMMKTYYDFFQKYRITLQSFPLETLSGDEYAANVKAYGDIATVFCLEGNNGGIGGLALNNFAAAADQIRKIAAISSPENNYIERVMVYFMDEPDLTKPEKRREVITNTNNWYAFLETMAEEIGNDTSGTYSAFKKIKNWESYIKNIPSVIPLTLSSVTWLLNNTEDKDCVEFLSTVNCLCPVYNCFEGEKAEEIKELFAKYNIRLWWYGCTVPRKPYPTYHIEDENLLSPRTVSWLQWKYRVDGNLYWDAAAFTFEYDANNEHADQYIDIYEYPYRRDNLPAGDGNLCYPGAPYGIYGPMPSVRLMSIRDGMEEYEMLRDLENRIETNKAAYGKNFSTEDAMEIYYNPIAYSSIAMNKDGAGRLDFTSLRADLLSMVSGIDKGLGLVMGDINVGNDGKAKFTYYVNEGSTVTVDGAAQTPVSGNRYEYTADLEKSTEIDATVTNASGETESYHRFVATPSYAMAEFAKDSDKDKITVSSGSDFEFLSDDPHAADGKSVRFNVRSKFSGNALVDGMFTPTVSIDTSLFGGHKPGDMTTMYISFYNPTSAIIPVKVRFYSGSAFTDFGEFRIEPGAKTVMLDIEHRNFAKIDSVDRITLEFDNAKDSKDRPINYTFDIDAITGEK